MKGNVQGKTLNKMLESGGISFNFLDGRRYILHYVSLQCREFFVSNIYLRTFVLKESVEKIHEVSSPSCQQSMRAILCLLQPWTMCLSTRGIVSHVA